MAFTVEDFRDIVRIIEQHPEWRAELRRLVLTEELLSLPQLVRELGEAQKRTEERLEELADAQKRTEKIIGELAESHQQLARDMVALARAVRTMGDDVAELKGDNLERKYREFGAAYFSPILRRAHVLSLDELQDVLYRAAEKGYISQDEVDEILWADVVVRGQKRTGKGEIFLVAEVSWGVGSSDVGRAVRRAGLLAKIGVEAIPVVGGRSINAQAAAQAHKMKVWQVIDGHTISPETSSGADKKQVKPQ